MLKKALTRVKSMFQDTVYDDFVARFKQAIEKNMVLGNGLEPGINQV